MTRAPLDAGQEPASPPPTSLNDADLIRAVAARDRAAFVALFERFAGRVKAYAIRAGVGPADADEIAQDVMVSVWRHAADFDPGKAAVSTWIFAIARNRRIDHHRRGARPAPDPEDPLFQPDTEPDGLAVMTAAERETRLQQALDSLPVEQRRVLVASFWRGLSHGQIAAEEALPLGTVKSRIRLAFRHLHALLGEDLAEGLHDD
ncbi:RNA polymerase sigma-70 factor (ECF subfamily) [Amaricoccus macauensis]|uniref:RNA polymerase sigma factor n=1 Tax=Amaricoccus macauensis TaxID=57001 RepID=A0A840SLQ5_9RHOB|nr:RNA polymerase sigma-70 factor (ECF subfamily) [Amaricoccus macauensis]